MYSCKILLLITLTWGSIFSIPLSDINSLVVSSTEATKEKSTSTENDSELNLQIYAMKIHTNVSNRFATTLITSKVRNLKHSSAETTFSVILPENAFISEFLMEIDGRIYKAYVKEKEEAKKIYEEAVAHGQSAGHVELNARDSKTFQVSVNVEPESKTIFQLTYEELLQRQLGQYELVVNIHPGQVVEDLSVQVNINESRPLTFVRTPALRTGNEISKNEDKLSPGSHIDIINATSAVIQFKPDKNEQANFAELLGSSKENGLAGQFIVQYDVERDPRGGEVLVRDGYFVHFFSPTDLKPLPKHIVFVLDHSGSMGGRKIYQLIEAMQNILSELNASDRFDIVRFASNAFVWNIETNTFDEVNIVSNNYNYGNLEPHLREAHLAPTVEATNENINKAKTVINDTRNLGMTNIMVGLEVGLFLLKRNEEQFPSKYQPMVIFLTDGLPNVGTHSAYEITRIVTKLNSGPVRASIFSLSFGYGADKDFLRKLSTKNLGFSRHIYEAADASLQLQDFYRKISSPLLNNVSFKYVDEVTDLTKNHYPIFFNGSELVVAGKTNSQPVILRSIDGTSTKGIVHFTATNKESISSLERFWAYLTVKQLLTDINAAENKTALTTKALDLALKYSFVTSVTSLIVVKPNKTESAENDQEKKSSISWDLTTPRFAQFSSGPVYSAAFPPPHANRYRGHPAPSYSPVVSPGIGPFQRNNTKKHLLNAKPLFPIAEEMKALMSPRTSWRGMPSHRTFTSTTPRINPRLPKWLQTLQKNNENVTTPNGIYILGRSSTIYDRSPCSNAPLNSTGQCTIIYDCETVYPFLTDFNVYLQYFCPVGSYAGVCCPIQKSTTVIP